MNQNDTRLPSKFMRHFDGLACSRASQVNYRNNLFAGNRGMKIPYC